MESITWRAEREKPRGRSTRSSRGVCSVLRIATNFTYTNRLSKTVSGKKVEFTTKPTTGIKDRDIMLQLYNSVGMYPGVKIPTPEVLELGVKFHTAEDFIRERLLPHLGIKAVN